MFSIHPITDFIVYRYVWKFGDKLTGYRAGNGVEVRNGPQKTSLEIIFTHFTASVTSPCR